jgi:hypothetical protein
MVVSASFSSAFAQTSAADAAKTLHDVAPKAEATRQFAFEDDLLLMAQRGSNPARLLSQARVRVAVGPEGPSLLRVSPLNKDEYLLISKGQKWAYVPKLKQYTEEEAAALADDEEGEPDNGAFSEERDLAEVFVRHLPTMNRLSEQYRDSGQSALQAVGL